MSSAAKKIENFKHEVQHNEHKKSHEKKTAKMAGFSFLCALSAPTMVNILLQLDLSPSVSLTAGGLLVLCSVFCYFNYAKLSRQKH